MVQEFEFKGMVFLVKLVNNEVCYRDKTHLGGSWTPAVDSIINKSLHPTFRSRLRDASINVRYAQLDAIIQNS